MPIEEYFKFKKQQFELEDLRVMSLQSIHSLNMFATLATSYIGLTSSAHKDSVLLMELKECSKQIYGIPKFVFCALSYTMEHISSMSKIGISAFIPTKIKSSRRSIKNTSIIVSDNIPQHSLCLFYLVFSLF